jgi:hypothetical protein
MSPVDDFVGRNLVAVERLAWRGADGSSDQRIGPIHLHFDGGRGAFFSGGTDWTFQSMMTRAGDESWLSPYLYEDDGRRWTIRDAAQEPPFADVRGARLESWASLATKWASR